jgi:hypothetical protein
MIYLNILYQFGQMSSNFNQFLTEISQFGLFLASLVRFFAQHVILKRGGVDADSTGALPPAEGRGYVGDFESGAIPGESGGGDFDHSR